MDKMKALFLIMIIMIFGFVSCKNLENNELSKNLTDNSMLIVNIRFTNTDQKISFEIKEYKIIDGKVKLNANMAKKNGNILIQILDSEKNVVAESIEKNPLVIYNEYQDENGNLRTIKSEISENEIITKYNIKKYPKYLKISRYSTDGSIELVKIEEFDK